jgi:hypothetical protein
MGHPIVDGFSRLGHPSMMGDRKNWVPHLRRGFIAPKVGYRAKHDPLFRVERV